MMGPHLAVGTVVECASLVIIHVNVRVIVEIPITMMEHVQDVNRKKLMITVLMMKSKLQKHYPL